MSLHQPERTMLKWLESWSKIEALNQGLTTCFNNYHQKRLARGRTAVGNAQMTHRADSAESKKMVANEMKKQPREANWENFLEISKREPLQVVTGECFLLLWNL